MRWSYPILRHRLGKAGLWPTGRLARIAWYVLGLSAVLWLLEKLLGAFAPGWSESLGGWIGFLLFLAGVLFSILGMGWLRRRMLWRVRNRLIVTYVFIGVIPVVLLVTMAFVTLYLFAGQFSGFIVTSEINSQLRSLEAVNAAIGNELAARLDRGETPTAESLAGLKKRNRAWARRHVRAWYGTKPLALSAEVSPDADFSFPDFLTKDGNSFSKGLREGQPFSEIVRDHGDLHLRVASMFSAGAQTLTVATSEPLDKDLIARMASNLGEVSLYPAGLTGGRASNAAPSKPAEQSDSAAHGSLSGTPAKSSQQTINFDGDAHSSFSVGALPEPSGSMDREITFGTPFRVVDWTSGDVESTGSAGVKVITRPSVLYGHLFASLGNYAEGIESILVGVGIFFAIIELIAIFTGYRMTRTVTAAVAQLYNATRHVDQGDFSHRIPAKSKDQLGALSHSFNSMTESIEKLILEQKEKHRLENELAIAQEVQDQLFPRQVKGLESLEVHGFCRPARTVSGDYYDFLEASSNKLILAVGDISGKGISAALLMATIHSAVRAYSVENLPQMREPVAIGAVSGAGRVMATWPEGLEVSPSALLSLLNHQLYESTPPEKYATLFLGIYDGKSNRLTYSNGGHLPPLLISEDGRIRRLEHGGTVVGLFDNMCYEEDWSN